MDPSASSPAAAADPTISTSTCSRPLVDVMWAFVVTLLALTFSLSGSPKHVAAHSRRRPAAKLFLPLIDIFQPLRDLAVVIGYSCAFVAMVRICHQLQDHNLRILSRPWLRRFFTLFCPWSESPARILAGCDIIFYLQLSEFDPLSKPEASRDSRPESELLSNEWLWHDCRWEVDETEAMVIGEDGARGKKNYLYKKKELSLPGKVALVWGEYFSEKEEFKFLPGYHELKFLRGNSGFAVIAVAFQAIGYVCGIINRSMQNLKVTPMEVIELILNIIMLIKASIFSICNPCSRPLVIYMNEEREKKFINIMKLKDIKSSMKKLKDIEERDVAKLAFGIFMITSICLVYIPLIYYIINIINASLHIMIVVPLFIFSLGIFIDLFISFIKVMICDSLCYAHSFWISIVINGVGYIWAIVVTLHYWTSQRFNIRYSS